MALPPVVCSGPVETVLRLPCSSERFDFNYETGPHTKCKPANLSFFLHNAKFFDLVRTLRLENLSVDDRAAEGKFVCILQIITEAETSGK